MNEVLTLVKYALVFHVSSTSSFREHKIQWERATSDEFPIISLGRWRDLAGFGQHNQPI